MEESLTIQQKAKKYKKLEWFFRISEYAVLPIPFAVMAVINRNEWFPNVETGSKVGIGGGMAIALLMFITFLITKNKQQESENKVEVGYICLMIGCVIFAVICTLIANILDELATIAWVGMSGIAAGFGFDVARKQMHKKYLKEKDVLDTAEKEDAVAQAKEERKTIKIKVTK